MVTRIRFVGFAAVVVARERFDRLLFLRVFEVVETLVANEPSEVNFIRNT